MTASIENRAGSLGLPVPRITPTAAGLIQHIDAGQWAGQRVGQGENLLSLHGGLGGFDQAWLLARAVLSDIGAWRVIAPSRPGYLDTPLDIGRAPEQQADAYAALLDALKIERVTVAAISAGGPSALQFAIRHPDRCRALILASAVTGPLDVPPVVLRRLRTVTWLVRIPGMRTWLRRKVLRDPKETARWSIGDSAVLDRTFNDPEAGPLFLAFQESVVEHLQDRLLGMINDVGLMRQLPRLPFERVRVPLLAIHGTADPVVPFAHAERVAGEVPGTRLHAIPGGEHAAVFTHLADVRQATASFLAGI